MPGVGGSGGDANGQGDEDLYCHLVLTRSHRGSLLQSTRFCLAPPAACLRSLSRTISIASMGLLLPLFFPVHFHFL